MQAKKTNAMMQSCKGSKRMQQADCDWARHDCGVHQWQIHNIPMGCLTSCLGTRGAQVKQVSGRVYHNDRVASGAAEDRIMVTRASAPHNVAASSISPFRRFCTWIKL